MVYWNKILKKWNVSIIEGSSNKNSKNVIEQIQEIFQNDKQAVIAITNDGPKGPPYIAKDGSYKIAKRANAQIISIFGGSTKFWEIKSWDKLRIPKPFGTIYIEFSDLMDYSNDQNNNAEMLTEFLNNNLDQLNKKIV